MSRFVRFLIPAVVAFAVVALPLAVLTAPSGAAGVSVSFSGVSPLGLPVLSCASSPNRPSVSVGSGQTLHVRNLTGHNAYIFVDGSKKSGVVGPNEGAPMTFPTGSFTVAMVPICLLNMHDAGKVTVTVAAPSRTPTPTPTPTPPPKAHRPVSPTRSAVTSPPTAPASATSPTPKHKHAAPVPSPDATPTIVAGPGQQVVVIGSAEALSASEAAPAPDYMLALVALIGVVGIGSAAIRALHHQYRRGP